MQTLRECFGQAVGQSLQHNGGIVVVVRFETCDMLFDADAGRHGESADVILGSACIFRLNKIAETEIRLTCCFYILLAQVVQDMPWMVTVRILSIVNLNVIVVDGIGRENADHRPGCQPFAIDDAAEHHLCIVEEFFSLHAYDLVFKNSRKLAGQLPALEKWRPVDVFREFFQRIVIECLYASELRLWGRVIRPVAGPLIGACIRQREVLFVRLPAGALNPDLLVFLAGIFYKCLIVSLIVRQKRTDYSHTSAGIQHVNDGRIGILRLDFYGGMCFGSGSATDEQRHFESQALHFFGYVYHFIQ